MPNLEAGNVSEPHHASVAVELLYELGDDPAFEIGMDEIIRAQCFLAKLAASRTMPEDPNRLCHLLAPIVCTTRGEQEEFYHRFERAIALTIESPDKEEASLDQVDRRMSQDRRRLLGILAAIAVCLLLMPAVIHYLVPPKTIKNTPSKEPVGGTKQTPPTIPDADEIPAATNSVISWPPGFEVPLMVIAGKQPAKDSESSWQWWLSIGIPLVCMTLFLGGWWRYRLHRATLYLERERAETPPDLLASVTAEPQEISLFRRPEVKRATIELRKRFSILTNRLNVAETVNRTVNSAGQFSPVLASRPVVPEYLALIERKSVGDHLAQLAMTFIARLAADEVHIDAYEFVGTPLQCFSWPGGRRKTLDQLITSYGGKRLVVCGPASCFFDWISGLPAGWADSPEDWSERILLTTTPVAEWGYQEWVLSAKGIIVLPLSPQGIAAIIQGIQSETGQYKVPFEWRPPLPELLAGPNDALLSRRTPSESDQVELIDALELYLGPRGLLWLSACAVYPDINWNLTLRLGKLIAPELCNESDVASFTRLPWFRSAWMPDWLRAKLIANLSAEQLAEIRFAIDSLLINAETNKAPKETALKISWDNRDLLTAVTDRWFQRFREQSPQHPAANDYVFARFMQTESVPDLAYRLRQRVSEFFRRQLLAKSRFVRSIFRGGSQFARWLKWPALIAISLTIAIGIRSWSGGGGSLSSKMPDPASTNSTGYGNDLPTAIDRAIEDLLQERSRQFLENMIPPNELGYVLAEGNLESLISYFDNGPQVLGISDAQSTDNASRMMEIEVTVQRKIGDRSVLETRLVQIEGGTPRAEMLRDLSAVQSFLRSGNDPHFENGQTIASFALVRAERGAQEKPILENEFEAEPLPPDDSPEETSARAKPRKQQTPELQTVAFLQNVPRPDPDPPPSPAPIDDQQKPSGDANENNLPTQVPPPGAQTSDTADRDFVVIRFQLVDGSWRFYNGADQLRRGQRGVFRGDYDGYIPPLPETIRGKGNFYWTVKSQIGRIVTDWGVVVVFDSRQKHNLDLSIDHKPTPVEFVARKSPVQPDTYYTTDVKTISSRQGSTSPPSGDSSEDDSEDKAGDDALDDAGATTE